MPSTATAPDRVRRLSEQRADRPVVLTMYLNLDPSEFATAPARDSAIRSLVDEARKRIEAPGVEHEGHKALRAALDRAEGYLQRDLSTERVHGVALFAAEPLDLFETITLPCALSNRIAVGHTPLVAPLAIGAISERWCVVLVNRELGRVMLGDGRQLAELADVEDDTRGQHDQGGWSQARYQRSVDKEVDEHLRSVAGVVTRAYDRNRFDHILVGCPHELVNDFRSELRTDVAELVAGELSVDVGTATTDDVLDAMRPALDEHDERLEREALDRLGGPQSAAGVADVLAALNERRVETLLIAAGWSEPGCVCPACGWVGAAGTEKCPADGTTTDQVDDLSEPAVELALQQDARALPVRRRAEQLRTLGDLGALLRF